MDTKENALIACKVVWRTPHMSLLHPLPRQDAQTCSCTLCRRHTPVRTRLPRVVTAPSPQRVRPVAVAACRPVRARRQHSQHREDLKQRVAQGCAVLPHRPCRVDHHNHSRFFSAVIVGTGVTAVIVCEFCVCASSVSCFRSVGSERLVISKRPLLFIFFY